MKQEVITRKLYRITYKVYHKGEEVTYNYVEKYSFSSDTKYTPNGDELCGDIVKVELVKIIIPIDSIIDIPNIKVVVI